MNSLLLQVFSTTDFSDVGIPPDIVTLAVFNSNRMVRVQNGSQLAELKVTFSKILQVKMKIFVGFLQAAGLIRTRSHVQYVA